MQVTNEHAIATRVRKSVQEVSHIYCDTAKSSSSSSSSSSDERKNKKWPQAVTTRARTQLQFNSRWISLHLPLWRDGGLSFSGLLLIKPLSSKLV